MTPEELKAEYYDILVHQQKENARLAEIQAELNKPAV